MSNAPVVGQGATACSHDDTYGYVVVSVGFEAREVVLAPLTDPSPLTGHQPAHDQGETRGVPAWDHAYTEEELRTMRAAHASPVYAHQQPDGSYRATGGAIVTFGQARYLRRG